MTKDGNAVCVDGETKGSEVGICGTQMQTQTRPDNFDSNLTRLVGEGLPCATTTPTTTAFTKTHWDEGRPVTYIIALSIATSTTIPLSVVRQHLGHEQGFNPIRK